MNAARLVLAALLLAVLACGRSEPPPRQYQMTGQILAIKPERNQVLVRHDDIKGFMPAMTMFYTVKDRSLLDGKEPGDLFTATLVVGEVNAYLSTLDKTGHAPIEGAVPDVNVPEVIAPGAPVSDASLIDQDGNGRSLASLRGHRVALTFIYTRCPLPDYCPLMDRNFAAVQQQIASDPALADVRLLSVTLDPAHDTAQVLQAHAKTRGADPARWSFLTGQPSAVAHFSSQFGIHFEGDPQDPAVVVHNLRTAVIDPAGNLVKVENDNTWTPAQLIADLQAVPAASR